MFATAQRPTVRRAAPAFPLGPSYRCALRPPLDTPPPFSSNNRNRLRWIEPKPKAGQRANVAKLLARRIRRRPLAQLHLQAMLHLGMIPSEIATRLQSDIKTVHRLIRRMQRDMDCHERPL